MKFNVNVPFYFLLADFRLVHIVEVNKIGVKGYRQKSFQFYYCIFRYQIYRPNNQSDITSLRLFNFTMLRSRIHTVTCGQTSIDMNIDNETKTHKIKKPNT